MFELEALEGRRLCSMGDEEDVLRVESARSDVVDLRAPLGGGTTRRIFGRDDRSRVVDTEEYPYLAVGRLDASWRREGVDSYCSGAMVSSYHFLTAAHCIYDSELGGFADEVVVTPGKDGRAAPVGKAEFSLLRMDSGYRRTEYTNASSAHDLALVTLDRQVLNATSTYLYVDYVTETFEGLDVFTAGYPSDQGGRRMFEQDGRTLRARRNEIVTKLDAANGQSGSAVVDAEFDGDYFIVGVLSSQDSRFTYVTRLTSERVKTLDRWILEDHRERFPRRNRRASGAESGDRSLGAELFVFGSPAALLQEGGWRDQRGVAVLSGQREVLGMDAVDMVGGELAWVAAAY